NKLRRDAEDNSILAKAAATQIKFLREQSNHRRTIYIIDSIKHPEEIQELRDIYGSGFYLFAVHSSDTSRDDFLKNNCHIAEQSRRDALISRDQDERLGHGQSTRESFHLADFFLTENGSEPK